MAPDLAHVKATLLSNESTFKSKDASKQTNAPPAVFLAHLILEQCPRHYPRERSPPQVKSLYPTDTQSEFG